MKKENKQTSAKNPYRSFGFEKVNAPKPEKSAVTGVSKKTNGDFRVRGNGR